MAIMKMDESIVVNCSVEDAFNLVADVKNHIEIFGQNREIIDHHGGPVKEGDTWTAVSSFMGREIKSTYTMAEITPPHRLVYKSSSSSADGKMTWTFEAAEGGTRISNYAEGEPKGFFGSVAAPLLKGNVEKMMREDMDRIKAMLEA